ncbi:MAG: phospholipase/carboxylesterase [Lysobacteraceae bacterium]|nr:MAG: phospholipase/carboxylesterase [Xanthomonadaceae bacterium]
MTNQPYLPAVVIEPSSAADASVVWLHGLGASGHDFEPIVPELQLPPSLPVRFVFPHAPNMPVTINGGMRMPAWYDILSMDIDRKIDSGQLRKSAQQTQALIQREIERGIAAERIVVAGFSQGGAVAYEAALTFPQRLAGLMTMSSYLATHETLQIDKVQHDLPIHVFHGTYDPVVPELLGQRAVAWLQENGFSPQYRTYPMQHQVCMEQINHISHWLQTVLK